MIYYLEINELMKINNNIKFESTTQKQLFDILSDKNFTLKEESVTKLNKVLPDGVTIKPVVVIDLDGEKLFNKYTTKVNRLNELETEKQELLKSL